MYSNVLASAPHKIALSYRFLPNLEQPRDDWFMISAVDFYCPLT